MYQISDSPPKGSQAFLETSRPDMRTTTETGSHQTVAPATSALPATQARLRNSCDACNTAKVKCSKERPCCRRCQRKEQFCVYSVSLRCSKRPVDGRNASAVRKHSRSTTASQPPTSVNHGLSLTTGLEAALDTTLDPSTTIPTPVYDFDSLSALSEVNFELSNLDDYFSTDTYLPPTNFHAYNNTAASTPPKKPIREQSSPIFKYVCFVPKKRPNVLTLAQ